MPPPRIAKVMPQHIPRQREGMSGQHLANVRDLPCCACGSLQCITAHHLLRTGEHGAGRKSSDQWAVPLCGFGSKNNCHQALHDDGDEDRFLASQFVDGRSLARALWRNKGDLNAMLSQVFKVLDDARLKRMRGTGVA